MISISYPFKNEQYKEVVLEGRLSEFRDALNYEIETIKNSSLSSLLIRNGHRVSEVSEGYLYRFYVEYGVSIPADTPCTLIVEKYKYDVTVINYEETFITILSKEDLGDTIPKAQLENGSIVLMKKLIERIKQNSKKSNEAGLRMLRKIPNKTIEQRPSQVKNNNDLNEQQYKAFEKALTENITFIWGPPGTGKTKVIGYIINQLYLQNRTVLLVSHTNTAVDGAMKNVCKKLKEADSLIDGVGFPALRLGASIDPQLVSDYEEVTFESHLKALSAELTEKCASLKEEEKSVRGYLNEKEEQKKQYHWMISWDENRSLFFRDIENLSEYEIKQNDLHNKISIQQKKVENARADISSCTEYFDVLRDYQSVKDDLKKIASEIEDYTEKCDYFSQEIENRQNQIVNHQKYEELSLKLSKCRSILAQQTKIQTTKREIELLPQKLKELDTNIQSCQENLVKAESKSALGRAFSGMEAPLKIQSKIQQFNADKQRISENLAIKKELLQKYESELFETKKLVIERDDIELVSNPTQLRIEVDEQKDKRTQVHTVLVQLQQQYDVKQNEFKEAKTNLEKERAKIPVDPDVVKEAFKSEKDILNDLRLQNSENDHLIIDTQDNINTRVEKFKEIYNTFGNDISYSVTFKIMDSVSADLQSFFTGTSLADIEKEIENLNYTTHIILAQITEIDNQINELRTQIISHVPIIGTTLTKAYLEDAIQERGFDTVILDEASMASIPALWCSAYLAERNIIIVGDFRQLPPIVVSEEDKAKKWLGTDIFAHSNMIDPERRPDYFIALNKQYRMENDIADIASHLYYPDNRLITDDYSPRWKEEKEDFVRWYGGSANSASINILDTKELHAWVTGIPQGKRKTRLNHLSAILCVDLAFYLTEKLIAENLYDKTKVLIVSPYRAHTNRIRQLIDHECKIRDIKQNDKQDEFNLIKAGTIHSFQGNEADIVIFDLVVDEPHWSNNLFMNTEDINEDLHGHGSMNSLRRMFNVAITRAKYKLFIIGNIDWCRKRAKENALGELLEALIDRNHAPVHDAKKLFPRLTFTKPEPSISIEDLSGKRLTCTQADYFNFLLSDILQAENKIVIYSPFMTKDRISNILPALQTAVSHGVQIYIVSKPYSEFKKSEQLTKRDCENILTANGINIIHKKKMHEKLVFIDSSILWMGSLNTLSFSNTQEIMERRQEENIFADYAEQMNIESLVDVVKNKEEQICPACEEEMLAAESNSGGIYWTCSKCDYSRDSKEIHPIKGELFCPKCGNPVYLELVNEPRWECEKDKKHYRKVRRSDLMLPKMLAKIPEDQLLKVVTILGEKKDRNDRKPVNDVEREILSLATVRAFDKKGRLVAGFNSNGEAGRYFGIDSKSIGKAINGIQKSCGGFQWRRYQAGSAADDI